MGFDADGHRDNRQGLTGLRILASVFSCHPGGGSGLGAGEDVLGWNLVRQIARFHNVWAVTYAENRPFLEQFLLENSISNIHFCYVDLPAWMRPMLKFQGSHQFYYYLWQIKAYFTARSLHRNVVFHLFHHITYANDWMSSFIGALLAVPYVRGPGGGAHRTPRDFDTEYGLAGRWWERIRTIGQWIFRHDPFFIRGQSRAKVIMVCNKESMSNIPSKWSHKVHFFPVNGVTSEDLALTSRAAAGTGEFRILSAGTLIKVKGFALAIRAFKEFVGRHPAASFSIFGSGPEGTRLRSIVQSSQLHSKVHLLAAVPREELLSEMASSDIFLFPSLRDGGGAVVIEAMSAGKPVVCLDTGGPGMHITAECGIKVTPHSPQSAVHDLAEALERLYLDEGLRLRLGKAARERAEEMYHWDRLGERLQEIYAQALGGEIVP